MPVRAHLRFLQLRLAKSEHLLEHDWDKIVKWCQDLVADPKANARTKMRANELLAAMADKGIEVADKLDKADRLDRGESTENVHHDHAVRYIKGVEGGDL